MFSAFTQAAPFLSIRQHEHEPTLIADPLADLLLSVAAIIVLVVIAILPTIPHHLSSHNDATRSIRALLTESSFRFEGRSVDPIFATEQGLVVAASSARVIPVDRIFFDADLVAMLGRMRSADETIFLLIEPKGLEAAFQFEVIANRYGPKRIHQIRLESGCNVTKGRRAAPDCDDQVRWPRGRRP
jgi:hypothetical protein